MVDPYHNAILLPWRRRNMSCSLNCLSTIKPNSQWLGIFIYGSNFGSNALIIDSATLPILTSTMIIDTTKHRQELHFASSCITLASYSVQPLNINCVLHRIELANLSKSFLMFRMKHQTCLCGSITKI